MDKETAALVKLAHANPWHLFTAAELASILGVSTNAMTAMKAAGAPFVVGKCTPGLLIAWLAVNSSTVEKVRT